MSKDRVKDLFPEFESPPADGYVIVDSPTQGVGRIDINKLGGGGVSVNFISEITYNNTPHIYPIICFDYADVPSISSENDYYHDITKQGLLMIGIPEVIISVST